MMAEKKMNVCPHISSEMNVVVQLGSRQAQVDEAPKE